MTMKNDRSHLGVFYVILSAILFGTMPLLTRIAYAHGSNAYTAAFGRFFFGSIVLGFICFVLPDCSIKIRKEQFLALLVDSQKEFSQIHKIIALYHHRPEKERS